MVLSGEIINYIAVFRQVNRENSVFRHFVVDPEARVRSTMYLTPFVFQLFVCNCLYRVDWRESINSKKIMFHNPRSSEPDQQKAFEGFLRLDDNPIPDALNSAFADIEALSILDSWATILPDAIIKKSDGAKFFDDLRSFQIALLDVRKSPDSARQQRAFSYIGELRYFIYRVRCNIFHGRKSMVEAAEPDLNKRIETYYRFLNGLTNLFFITIDKVGDY